MPPRRETVALLFLTLALTNLVACREANEPASPAADRVGFDPQPTPEHALRAYMRLLERKVKEPDLALYTPETRSLLAGLAATDAQQENELGSLRRAIDSADVRSRGELAVIRFSSKYREVPPYFLRRGEDGWMLDLATPRRVLVFDRSNEWTFKSRDHEYAFAFVDR